MRYKKITHSTVLRELVEMKDMSKALLSQRYFKTGKGEYAEGDIFLGVTVPQTRTVVKKYWSDIQLSDIQILLKNKYHEVRLAAILFLVAKYMHTKDAKTHRAIFSIYTKNTAYINNWDLVDTSAATIVGDHIARYMSHKQRFAFINAYCESKNLWKNRIVVVASFAQIKIGNEKMLYAVAEKLLHHPHDLMHKAIGWMLREVGKRVGRKVLEKFLRAHAVKMPRTMLRYALEHFSPNERTRYMEMRKTTR